MEVNFVPMLHQTEEGKIFLAEISVGSLRAAGMNSLTRRSISSKIDSSRFMTSAQHCLYHLSRNDIRLRLFCGRPPQIAEADFRNDREILGAARAEEQRHLCRGLRPGGQQEVPSAVVALPRCVAQGQAPIELCLKVRKQRGKISADEWNAAVAKAQELLEHSERGESVQTPRPKPRR